MPRGSPEPERIFSVAANTNPPSAHTLPAAPAGFGEGRWIPPGESVEVAGMNLPGGMLYVGGRLKALNGGTDPCLISGQYNVARVGNYRSEERRVGKECVSTCRSRWSPCHSKQKNTYKEQER